MSICRQNITKWLPSAICLQKMTYSNFLLTYSIKNRESYLWQLVRQAYIIPLFSSSKQAKAFLMTSSGSVPFSFSPNIVRNIVKLIGPGASFIIASNSWSAGFLPVNAVTCTLLMRTKCIFKCKNICSKNSCYQCHHYDLDHHYLQHIISLLFQSGTGSPG